MSKQNKSAGAVTLFEVIMIPACLAILLIVAAIVLDKVTQNQVEDQEEAKVQVLNAAKLDTPQQRMAMTSALMADKEIQSLSIAWLMQMSNLEAVDRYKERDALFFQALGYLNPYEMFIFLESNKEHVLGYGRQTLKKAQKMELSLHPVIQMPMKQRKNLRACYSRLKSAFETLHEEDPEEMGLIKKVIVKLNILYPKLKAEPCDINPIFY